MSRLTVLALFVLCGSADARAAAKMEARAKMEATSRKNPIRKVVTMLQSMSAKVKEEKKEKEEMFDKFMCYCKKGKAELEQAIADAETKIPQVKSTIKESAAKHSQLKAAVKQAKADREAARGSVDQASAIRKKSAASSSETVADLKANIAALEKAIPAIESGMGGSFLQTAGADTIRKLSVSMDMNSADRDLLSGFLEEDTQASYAPKSGEILGILKQMKDEMEKDLAAATGDEEAAAKDFESLLAAKKKESASLTKQIEEKSMRVGELAVSIASAKNDLEDTEEQLEKDKELVGSLDESCATKKDEWDEFTKMSSLELAAIADTIKFLNDDDALELFKKTLPSASSFMQLQFTAKAMRLQALKKLKSRGADSRLDLIQLALHGSQTGFEKIIRMIDTLIGELKKEQKTDDDKLVYCDKELDSLADEAKSISEDISRSETDIADAEETLATLTSELETLVKSIEENDKRVAEATSVRKEDHQDFVKLLASNKAAKEILQMAKNRLNKFYNPELYIAPPKVLVESFSQVQSESELEPAPEADLTFKKKDSAGVIEMINMLVTDIEKENTELDLEEKHSQKLYEEFMAHAAEERQVTSKAITDKTATKADTAMTLEKSKESLKKQKKDQMETEKLTANIHAECDWILKYAEMRKEARASEIESLDKAKAVLSGADYSLLQNGHFKHLRGARHVRMTTRH